MLLELSNITKSFSGIPLLKNITFKVDDHDKIAIIGVNGAGKSTILKMIMQEEDYDNGNIFQVKDIVIGYLSQNHTLNNDKTVYDTALAVFDFLKDIELQMRETEQQMAEDASEEVYKRYDSLMHRYDDLGGYTYLSKITGVLKGLGFLEEEFNKRVDELSGGQKTRLALACILLREPDLLLLDEPTNHLDADAITFLENYLRNYRNAIIVVSHDRYFIDQVSNMIIEVENGKSKTYRCKYGDYAIIKKAERNIELKHYLNQQKEIAKIQESIDTLKSFNREKSIKRAESKEKQLAKIDVLDKPESLPEDIRMSFVPKIESGYDVLKLQDVSVSYDDVVFAHADLDIKKQERIALVGENGIGKTTLFKAVLKELPIQTGRITYGAKVEIAYYDQEHRTLFNDKTIFDQIHDEYPLMTNTEVRNALALFNFKGEDVFKVIGDISGGEKGRVVLTDILLKRANFLILDEPTNHLDIASKEVLEDALNDFEGTVLFISHDRYFINKVATRVVELARDHTASYPGNYDNYIARRVVEKEETAKKENTEYIAQKEAKRIDRKARNQLKKIENDITKLEEKIDTLTASLASEEVLNDYKKYNDVNEEIAASEAKLEELMEEWETLQE